MSAVESRSPARRVLIVSPHFPPANAADMQRVRMSLPYFREFGWEPHVLAVADSGDAPSEPLLCKTIPADAFVERVSAMPTRVTGLVGIRNIALRAWPALYRAGARTITEHHIDLVYISTTMFLSMPLGRVWRRRFGTPYVLDIQDPWLSDYYETHQHATPPRKYGVARRVHALLEPWTMKTVSGLIAVSESYLTTLRRRYPWIDDRACATIPFAAAQADFDLLQTTPQPQHVFARDGQIHGVYVGRGGDDMRPALEILFGALRTAQRAASGRLDRLRLHFIGTDYAAKEHARQTVAPVAEACGVGGLVDEQTARVPYFEALQLMTDASFLVLVGSDDPNYTASKIYPYLLARKPLLAVVHEASPLVPLLSKAATLLVTFNDGNPSAAVLRLTNELPAFLDRLDSFQPSLSPDLELACSAREMTRRQCQLFDRIATRAIAA